MRIAMQSLHERPMEWFSSGVMVVWSATLSLPGDLLAQPGFVAFHRFGLSETFWAAAFAAFGVGGLVALFINGRWPRTPYIRICRAVFGALSWGQVSWLLYMASEINGTPISTGCGVYALLAAFELISIQTAAYDARYNNA